MRILVTGGAGYIGTHTLLQLGKANHEVMVYDNFSNSTPEAIVRVRQLVNADFLMFEGDIQDPELLDEAFNKFKPDAVVHLAGLKAVAESNLDPMRYYSENVSGTIELLKVMSGHECNSLVFSSSATVYGEARYLPLDEAHPIRPSSPYGRTKYFIEEIIRDWVNSSIHASAINLRYFNPVGADFSGKVGENPLEVPNNLLPYIVKVASGNFNHLKIYGNDYETRDGTGERDYIHVEDLARAHLSAVEYISEQKKCETVNIGTGFGITVLELVSCFEKISRNKVPYQFYSRREGDIARSIASCEKARRVLGWSAIHGIDEICSTAWLWQLENPNGFGSN